MHWFICNQSVGGVFVTEDSEWSDGYVGFTQAAPPSFFAFFLAWSFFMALRRLARACFLVIVGKMNASTGSNSLTWMSPLKKNQIYSS